MTLSRHQSTAPPPTTAGDTARTGTDRVRDGYLTAAERGALADLLDALAEEPDYAAKLSLRLLAAHTVALCALRRRRGRFG